MSSGKDTDRVSHVVVAIVLPIAIYIAFWRIDWGGGDSLLQYVLPVVFCVVVPSIAASLVTAAIGTARR